MRVSENMLIQNFLRGLHSAQGKIFERNLQVTTGKKLNRPSDAPSDSSKLVRLRDDVSRINQYYRNINQADLILGTTEDALNNLSNLIIRVQERSGYGVTGTMTQQDRDAIAAELRSLQEEMVRIASTKVGGKYLFSGSQVTTEPLVLNAGSYNYQGDDRALMIEISQGEKIQVNVTGDESFSEPSTDLINTLTTLIQQLESGDLDNARQSMAEIQTAREMISEARVRVGTSRQRLDGAKVRLDQEFLQLTTAVSEMEDADMAEAISGLVQAETGLRATLSVGARINQLNLFDILG
jgi:flagellar hook-associated protein 3 FlgL